jgi:hypothetical protein
MVIEKREKPLDSPASSPNKKKLKPSSKATVVLASESLSYVSIVLTTQTRNSPHLINAEFLVIEKFNTSKTFHRENINLYDIISQWCVAH